jgi:hypothetical protein
MTTPATRAGAGTLNAMAPVRVPPLTVSGRCLYCGDRADHDNRRWCDKARDRNMRGIARSRAQLTAAIKRAKDQ